MRLDGLELVTPAGRVFAWAGYRVTPKGLRIDEFVSSCATCAAPFRVPVRLLREIAKKYAQRTELMHPGEGPRIRIQLTRAMQRAMHNVQLIRCANHRNGRALV